jgi:septum site-determining protein MinD
MVYSTSFIFPKFFTCLNLNIPKLNRKVVCQNAFSPLSFKESFTDSQMDTPFTTRTIVVTSGKGGVGKTTATANIGMSIARLGYKTGLIDADIGLRNLDLLLGLENRILYTVMDVFESQCRLDQALIRDKRWKNLSLLSISKNRQRYNVTRKNMQNLVKALANLNFRYILIDCPAGIDVGFINAISPAQEALIVSRLCVMPIEWWAC